MEANNSTPADAKETIDPARFYKTAKRTNYKNVICRNGCGFQIYFDDEITGKYGNLVPLDPDTGEPHACSNSPWYKRQKLVNELNVQRKLKEWL